MDRAHRVMFSLLLLLPPLQAEGPSGLLRLETKTVPGGAELVTVFSDQLPLVTVLRDTLGDSEPANDRLRYVWVHSFASPGFFRRLSAATPFLYRRLDSGIEKPSKHPKPLHDLASEQDRSWLEVSKMAMQFLLFDSQGALIRSSTRSYNFNMSENRAMYTMQALALLSRVGASEDGSGFGNSEAEQLSARLSLTESRLGGLVSEQSLKRVHDKTLERRSDARGRNWEILRQKAEQNGLHFEPLALPGESASHAVLWIEPEELERKPMRWDGRFLHISNPWTDSRIRNWKGYEQVRWVDDSTGAVVEPHQSGASPRRMVPLAVYSLDHRKVPLLLVNFRSGFQPRRREYQDRVAKDIVAGLLGLSRFADWEFFAARAGWEFVSGRWGASNSISQRRNAYSQFRQFLTLDKSLDPELRKLLIANSDRHSANPLETKVNGEAELAVRQYKALLAYAFEPEGLKLELEKDRQAELFLYSHSSRALAFRRFAQMASLGMYTPRENKQGIRSALSNFRLTQKYTEFLESAMAESAQLEIDYSVEDLVRAATYLAESLNQPSNKQDAQLTQLLSKVLAKTEEEKLRSVCLAAIHRTQLQTTGDQ